MPKHLDRKYPLYSLIPMPFDEKVYAGNNFLLNPTTLHILKLFDSKKGKLSMTMHLLIGFVPFVILDILESTINVTAFVFRAICDGLCLAYDASKYLLSEIISNQNTNSQKLRNIFANGLLLLVFLGLAAKNSGIANLNLFLPFAAPIFFLALGVFEFFNTIAFLKDSDDNLKKLSFFSSNEFKAATACFVGLGSFVMAISGSLVTVPFLTPVMFTAAFAISFTQSLIIAIANIRDHGGVSRESAWNVLNLLYKAFGLFAVATSFLLPALGLTIAPLWIAMPLIIAAVTRIIPMFVDTDKLCNDMISYAHVPDSSCIINPSSQSSAPAGQPKVIVVAPKQDENNQDASSAAPAPVTTKPVVAR
jgi:hypothetical protein